MKVNSKFDLNKQADFFDDVKYQYSKKLLVNPPFHTKLEIESIINLLPELSESDSVIDFGAGSGRVTIPLLIKKINVTSVDVSRTSLAVLEETVKINKLDGLSIESKIPNDKKFSAIVGADILHHIDLDEYIPIFYKSVEKGGKLIFSEPNAFNPFWYFILPIFSSWEIEKGILNCRRSNLKMLFKKYGFSQVNIYGRSILPGPIFNFSQKLCRLNDVAGNLPLLKEFSYRFLIEAIK